MSQLIETIIASTTKQPDEDENSLLQRVLSVITLSFCAGYLAELILNNATSPFSRRDISISATNTSPLGLFRNTNRDIVNSRDVEANLFEEFQASLGNNDDKRKLRSKSTKNNSAEHTSTSSTKDSTPEPRDNKFKYFCPLIRDNIDSFWKTRNSGDHPAETNPCFDIRQDTAGLREIKDVCDELHILKSLAEAQALVWKQAMRLKDGHLTNFNYDTPTEKNKEIQEMINEAETVQKSLEALLDLKQKQANINEAKSAREQSLAVAKQADTIMAFTAVTVLFLPASFLTCLFALNISSSPHKDGDVAYQGQWIFPIIFGGSLGLSTIYSSRRIIVL